MEFEQMTLIWPIYKTQLVANLRLKTLHINISRHSVVLLSQVFSDEMRHIIDKLHTWLLQWTE